MSAPTFINLPPPPSDPATPSEMPFVHIRYFSVLTTNSSHRGTPNSNITTMSELSTVAIKDGHRGHPHHHAQGGRFPLPNATSGTTNSHLDAERADRISRLAGLERLTAVRQSSSSSLPPGASASHPQGYFESPIPPQMHKERSTVGSASATGSVGGGRTWASGSASDAYDQGDKMSEDQDQEMDTSSNGGFSDEGNNGSLVGFGEGAGSTMGDTPMGSSGSGVKTPQRGSYGGTPTQGRVGGTGLHLREASGISN